jgi:uncharacterized protein (DUF1786 family)
MIGNAAAVALVIIVLVVGGVIAYALYQWGQHLAISKKTRAELTATEDHRRLSEMAVTAHEHTDLKLAEINMQLAQQAGPGHGPRRSAVIPRTRAPMRLACRRSP